MPTEEQLKELRRLEQELNLKPSLRIDQGDLLDKLTQPMQSTPIDQPVVMPILVLDFDGVLHSYTSGWKGADVIPDPPVPGAIDFLTKAFRHFRVIIVSSRCNQPGGCQAIRNWLAKWDFPALEVSEDGSKPAAFITIDDRAITFNGLWPNPEDLKNFKPWYQRNLNPNDNTSPNQARG